MSIWGLCERGGNRKNLGRSDYFFIWVTYTTSNQTVRQHVAGEILGIKIFDISPYFPLVAEVDN